MISYDICVSLSDLIPLVWYTLGSSIITNGIFSFFYGWVIFHCIYLHLFYPFVCRWIFSLLPCPDSSVGKEPACNAADPSSIPGSGRPTEEGIGYPLQYSWASLVAQLVKNLPAMWETWVPSTGLGRCPEGKDHSLQYSAWRMVCIVHGVTKSHTRLSDFHFHILAIVK